MTIWSNDSPTQIVLLRGAALCKAVNTTGMDYTGPYQGVAAVRITASSWTTELPRDSEGVEDGGDQGDGKENERLQMVYKRSWSIRQGL